MSFSHINSFKDKIVFKQKVHNDNKKDVLYHVLNLVLEDSPSLHAKSCPVPIQRQQSSTQSGYTTHSPRSSPVL